MNDQLKYYIKSYLTNFAIFILVDIFVTLVFGDKIVIEKLLYGNSIRALFWTLIVYLYRFIPKNTKQKS